MVTRPHLLQGIHRHKGISRKGRNPTTFDSPHHVFNDVWPKVHHGLLIRFLVRNGSLPSYS